MPAALKRAPTFAPNPHRRAMLAKVHLAKKELGLADDDYRAVLLRVAGVQSAGDCTDAQLAGLLDDLKAKGFKPKTIAKPQARRAADHPTARKARAMWISLHQLGAIANPSEQALEAFAQRQLGVERLQWADQSLGYRLIEALKAMAERHGWVQTVARGTADPVRVLKISLARALLAKLVAANVVPADWTLERAAWSLLGMEEGNGPLFWPIGELDVLVRGLADKLRTAARA
jgi:phage gp16-like protein